ncbi:MAG TPA: hypothetical protein VMT16_17035 [Thermoanaerobaculia bacterium]|nr:hypothetical protein [Thermoanaerobaculia bacterium]
MAKRSSTTFQKRQREMARQAKRREKLERRQERNRQKAENPREVPIEPHEVYLPEELEELEDSTADEEEPPLRVSGA